MDEVTGLLGCIVVFLFVLFRVAFTFAMFLLFLWFVVNVFNGNIFNVLNGLLT
jgi:hypothetical protein